MSGEMKKLTVVLFGKTGNGKSSTGNTLLGQNKFDTGVSTRGVTTHIQRETCRTTIQNCDVEIQVVDTPGMFERRKFHENALELFDIETMDPDVFLFVLQAGCRFSEEEQLTADLMEIVFGKNVFQNTIIIVTYGDRFENDELFNNFLTDSVDVQNLMELCGNRVLKIENATKNFDWAKFLRFTDQIKRSSKMPYKNKHSDLQREIIRTYFQQNNGGKIFCTQLKEISELITKKLPNWTRRLLIGTVIGGFFLVTAAVMTKPTAGPAAVSSAMQQAATAGAEVVEKS